MTVPQANMKTVWKGKGTLEMTIALMQEVAKESIPQAKQLAKELYTGNLAQDAESVYDYIKANVRYINDKEGTEQVRTLARLIKDGEGDCDDMATSACAILAAMGHKPRFCIVAQNNKTQYSHVFCVVGDMPHADNYKIKGYAIDPVPPLTYFNQIAPNITKIMEVGLDHYKLSGLGCNCQQINGLGGISAATNTTQRLILARDILTEDIKEQGGKASPSQSRDMRKITALIKMNGAPEQAVVAGMMSQIHDITLQGVIIPKQNADLDALTQYLQAYENEGLEGIGKFQIKNIFKKNPAKVAARQEKKAAKKEKREIKKNERQVKKAEKKVIRQEKRAQGKGFFQKVLKVMPLTLAARNAFLAVCGLNVFHIAIKLHIVFTNSQFSEKKAKIKKMWLDMGGKFDKLEQAVEKGWQHWQKKQAKKGKGVKGVDESIEGLGEITTAALISAATAVIGAVTAIINGGSGKEDMKKAMMDLGVGEEAAETASSIAQDKIQTALEKRDAKLQEGSTPESEGFQSSDDQQVANEAMTNGGNTGTPPDTYADSGIKALYSNPLFIGGMVVLVGGAIYMYSNKSK